MHRPCTNCRAPILAVQAVVTGGRCLRCWFHWRHAAKDAPIVADTSQWSEASKRSRSYLEGAPLNYFDEFYWCRACGSAAVFTARDQKNAYEVEKRYFLQTRTLCDACYTASRARRPVREPKDERAV